MTVEIDIVQSAWEIALWEAPIKLVECLEKALETAHPAVSKMEIAERAQQLEHRVRAEFSERMEGYKRRRLVSPLSWGISDTRTLVLESPKLRLVPQVLDYLRNQISAVEFEHLCGSLLELGGSSEVVVTDPSGDEGIDVIGRLYLPEMGGFVGGLLDRLLGGPEIFLLAQCKRYGANRVSVDTLREFYGAVSIASYLSSEGSVSRGRKQLVDMGWRAVSPTLLAFFTTSQYVPQAMRLAQNLGILLVDGEGICQALIDANLVQLEGDVLDPDDIEAIRALVARADQP